MPKAKLRPSKAKSDPVRDSVLLPGQPTSRGRGRTLKMEALNAGTPGKTIADLLAKGFKYYCSECYREYKRPSGARCRCGGPLAHMAHGRLIGREHGRPGGDVMFRDTDGLGDILPR